MKKGFASIAIIFYLYSALSAQTTISTAPTTAPKEGKTYADGHGGKVFLPLGDISFADEVRSFTKGEPPAIPASSDSSLSIGVPDFDGGTGGFTTLGCGGSLVLHFKDNALVNIKGPDLFVFEMGKYIEPTNLDISKDGVHWINVGKINGAKAAVDIGDSVKQGDIFYYVRLTDLKTECSGSWPGADIDAVAAIGSAKRISLNSTVLFGFNQSTLKSDAKKELDKIIAAITDPNVDVMIEGHTDNVGTRSYNQTLSENRAKAVRDYIQPKLAGKKIKVKSAGYADKNPVASNDTPQGQEMNRRVEIILIPKEQ
jgi:outer membrane protein OmpA-like peptidoglycan-associated protein